MLQWFEYKNIFPFEYNKTNLSLNNALWLVECSRLSYIKDARDVYKILYGVGFHTVRFYDTGGTQAFVAIADDYIITAFRGTEKTEAIDIRNDLDCLYKKSITAGMVHRGFRVALDLIWDDLIDFIHTYKSNRSIWWTGHSLGAALATIAASRVGGSGLYTFGSPRVGNRKFTRHLNSTINHYRFVNNNDLVSTIPPFPFYYHGCNMIYIDNVGNVYPNTSPLRKIIIDWKQRYTSLKSNKIYEIDFTDIIDDHNIRNYCSVIRNNLFKTV